MRKRTLIPGVSIGLLRDCKSDLDQLILFELVSDGAEPKRVVGFSKKGVTIVKLLDS